jgi:putative acetyltransferase
MTVVIRPVVESDGPALHELLTSRHVARGSMRVPLSSPQQTLDRIKPRTGLYQLAAEADGDLVGFAELVTFPDEPRAKHVGEINMVATRVDRGGQGIGRSLMDALIDLADNWLQIKRLSLVVFTDNAHAVRLYERLGFETEGTMRRLAFGDGRWMDAHLMARLRD